MPPILTHFAPGSRRDLRVARGVTMGHAGGHRHSRSSIHSANHLDTIKKNSP